MNEQTQGSDLNLRVRLPLPLLIPLGIAAVIGVCVLVFSKILLAVPEGIAAAIAAVTAVNILAAFAYLATRDDVKGLQVAELGLVALYPIAIGAVMAIVGFGAATTETGASQSSGPQNTLTDVTVSASNIQFDTSTITVAAGKQVTIHFDNKDASSVQHDIAVYQTEAAKQVIYDGKTIPGGSSIDYTFKTPAKPGTYFFRCDVHPTSMMGKFVVK